MSARKRSRTVEDDDDTLDVESASSSLRSNQNKRSRVALAAEHGGSALSDVEDDESNVDLDALTNDALTRHRLASMTPCDSDDENAERDELIGTRYMRKQMRKQSQNAAQPNGIIEEVVCKNFMCHAKLRITLGPNINFICGHNGSGKSAILTALTICLGSKAASTNRGASMKDMIKEGEDAAVLSVKIKNQGEGAYRPEVYGKSIIVERHISRTSAPGFKLKSAEGKIISTKKRDLDEILDFFSLQLDNPINVLNQDMARQFLSNSTPSEKYKFFIKGTLLESLDNDYRIIEETLDSINAKLMTKKDDIAVLQQRAKEAGKRRMLLKSSESIRTRVKETQRMHAWAQVEEQEQFLANYTQDVATAEDNVRQAQSAAESASGVFEGHGQGYEQAKRFVTDLQQELEPLESDQARRKEELDAGKLQLLELQTNMRNAQDDWKAAKQRKKLIESQITTERRILADAEGSGHTDRLDQLESLEAAYTQLKSDREEMERRLPELEKSKLENEQTLQDFKNTVDEHKAKSEEATASLERLKAAQGQRFAGYTGNMARLVQAIDAETGWRRKPVGPIGQSLKLKKPQWSSLIERTLGGVLNGFAVTCREDQIRLRNISDRVKFQATAYIVPSQYLDTTGKEPSPEVDTILRVLEIDDDLVRNVLIIQNSIEQVVLINDRQTAHDYLYSNQRPACVKSVLTYHDNKQKGARFAFSRSGLNHASTLELWKGASRLQANREDQIRRQQDVTNAARNALDATLQEHRRLQQALTSSTQAITLHRRKRQEMLAREQRHGDEIDALKEEIEQNRPKDGRLQELQQQLQEAVQQESGHNDIMTDLIEAKEALDSSQRETKRLLNEATDKVNDHGDRLTRARECLDTAEQRRLRSLRDKNQAFERIKDHEEELEAHKQRRAEQEELVKSFVDAATGVGSRIPVEPGATTAILDARLDRFQADLERRQREAGGSLEELTNAHLEAKMIMDDAVAQYTRFLDFAKAGQRSLATRTERWKYFRRFITMRARIMFHYLLSERSFRGDVLVDHRNKRLDISVEPDLTRSSDAGREAKTLSGGEKSFATICLLLSIWEAIASPIRCLDEFDVFMDSVNRATSVGMIVQTARRAIGRQFILITPQSMQNVSMGDDVHVFKMPDPERGQQVLPFTQGR